MIPKSGHRFSDKIMLNQSSKRSGHKPAPDVIRGGSRFSVQIMRGAKNPRYMRVTRTCSSAERPPRTSLAQRAIAAVTSAGSVTFSA